MCCVGAYGLVTLEHIDFLHDDNFSYINVKMRSIL